MADGEPRRPFYYEGSYAVSTLVNPNGAATNTTYDAWGRPSTTTIADGAVTNYAYSYNPNTQTASVTDPSSDSPGTTRWTKTVVDGFGRTISVIKGYASTSVSEVDTQYAPCGCSPLGKVKQVSEPYNPNSGSPVWTTYTYDASGRMLTSTAPDGSVTPGLCTKRPLFTAREMVVPHSPSILSRC